MHATYRKRVVCKAKLWAPQRVKKAQPGFPDRDKLDDAMHCGDLVTEMVLIIGQVVLLLMQGRHRSQGRNTNKGMLLTMPVGLPPCEENQKAAALV